MTRTWSQAVAHSLLTLLALLGVLYLLRRYGLPDLLIVPAVFPVVLLLAVVERRGGRT